MESSRVTISLSLLCCLRCWVRRCSLSSLQAGDGQGAGGVAMVLGRVAMVLGRVQVSHSGDMMTVTY